MGTPNDVSLSIALAADYGPASKGGATWDHDECLNVLIPNFRSDFLLKLGKGLVCLLAIQVWLCVWGVHEANFIKLSPGKVFAPLFLSHPKESFHMVLFDRVCNLFRHQGSVSAAVDYLACKSENLGGHGRTNINEWAKNVPRTSGSLGKETVVEQNFTKSY